MSGGIEPASPVEPSDKGAHEKPMGLEVAIEARMERLVAHLDPDVAPPPLFGPRTEASR